jgi:hypothetical protein
LRPLLIAIWAGQSLNREQEIHTQIDALHKAGVDFIFVEKKPGGDTKRQTGKGASAS